MIGRAARMEATQCAVMGNSQAVQPSQHDSLQTRVREQVELHLKAVAISVSDSFSLKGEANRTVSGVLEVGDVLC